MMRPLNHGERTLITFLLDAEPFPGREALRQQLETAEVRDDCGPGDFSIFLSVAPDAHKAQVKKRVPIEAIYREDDDMPVQVLLHVLDGVLDELEIFRMDSKLLSHFPNTSELTIFDSDTYKDGVNLETIIPSHRNPQHS